MRVEKWWEDGYGWCGKTKGEEDGGSRLRAAQRLEEESWSASFAGDKHG